MAGTTANATGWSVAVAAMACFHSQLHWRGGVVEGLPFLTESLQELHVGLFLKLHS